MADDLSDIPAKFLQGGDLLSRDAFEVSGNIGRARRRGAVAGGVIGFGQSLLLPTVAPFAFIGGRIKQRRQERKDKAEGDAAYAAYVREQYESIVMRYGEFNPLVASMNAQRQQRPDSLYSALSEASTDQRI